MDVDISADDIAWFRSVRAHPNEGEVPAAILVPPDTEPWAFELACLGEESSPLQDRLERVMMAFFLHAAFAPGRYALRRATNDATHFEVTTEHATLLPLLSWRKCMVDGKRPYGVSCWFEFDMARALGVPIGLDTDNEETLAPEDEARLAALHLEMPVALQAYVEHAALEPGRWLTPKDGWACDHCVRCVPVCDAAVEAYRRAVAGMDRESARWHEAWSAGHRLFRSQ